MSVLENVTEGPVIVKGIARANAVEIAEMNLDRVGLLFKKDEYPNRLSGGQKQRVRNRKGARDGTKTHGCSMNPLPLGSRADWRSVERNEEACARGYDYAGRYPRNGIRT